MNKFVLILVLTINACALEADGVDQVEQAVTTCSNTINTNNGSAFNFSGSADLWVLRAFMMGQADGYSCSTTSGNGTTAQCVKGNSLYFINYVGNSGSRRNYSIFQLFSTTASAVMDPAYPARVKFTYTNQSISCFTQPTVAHPTYVWCPGDGCGL